MRHRLARTVRAAVVAIAAWTLTACGALHLGGGARYDLAGSWEGSFTAEGQRMPGTLEVRQSGRALEVFFVSPGFDLEAAGEGEVDDEGSFWLELDYDLQCPGNALLEGTVSDDRAGLSGTLEATDCTGTVSGSFSFGR